MKSTRLLKIYILSVILMVALLATIFFIFYGKTTEKQLIYYGQIALDGSALYVDSMMASAKDLFDNLSLDSEVSMLLNYDKVPASNLLTGLRRLYKYESSNYFIDSIYIYNRINKNVYVSSPHIPEAVYPIEDFPDIEASNILEDYSNFKNSKPIFRTFNSFFPSVNKIPYISFIRFNALSKDNTSNVIMLNIREDILSNLISKEKNMGGGLMLLSSDLSYSMLIAGDIKANTDSLACAITEKLEKYQDFTVKVDGRKYIVCTADVLNSNAKLVLVADESVMAKTTRTKGYGNSILMLSIVSLLTFCLCYMLFRHIWLNAKTQMENIQKSEEEKRKLVEENYRSRLISLLHSNTNFDELDKIKEKTNNAKLVVFSIDYYQDEQSNKTEKTNLKKKIILNLEHTLDEKVIFSVYEDNEKCILCISESTTKDEVKNAKAILEQELNILTTVIISNTINLEEVHQTYEDVCQFLSYRLLLGPGKLIEMSTLEKMEVSFYSIPESALKRLSEEILKLNTLEAISILKEILCDISSSSYKSAQLCLVNLSTVLDDAFGKLLSNNGIESPISGSLTYKILKLEYINQITNLVQEMLEQIEQEILSNKGNRQTDLINEIKKIIDQRYCEQDFSIITVADELKMNAAYLGRLFKKVTGSSFREQILEQRMKEACNLLSKTDEQIDVIVSKVGFSDTPYFYKMFKKMTGCTPVRYRIENKK